MTDSRLTFRGILAVLERYERNRSSSLDQENGNALQEIRRRLRQLDNQFGELMNLNARLVQADNLSTSFDPATETITFTAANNRHSLKLNRADPNVPVKVAESVFISAYQAGSNTLSAGAEGEPLRLRMEELLESYYQGAHRIVKLLQRLPALNKFECREITIVRNKLVEHPEGTECYSFGFGTGGPVVRAIHTPGREWIDGGLLKNTRSFMESLLEAVTKAAVL